jgi:hypothetical protein
MKLIHAAVTGRAIKTGSPILNDDASLTETELAPAGTWSSVISTFGPVVVWPPDPRIRKAT